jgi:hypothetical protein
MEAFNASDGNDEKLSHLGQPETHAEDIEDLHLAEVIATGDGFAVVVRHPRLAAHFHKSRRTKRPKQSVKISNRLHQTRVFKKFGKEI